MSRRIERRIGEIAPIRDEEVRALSLDGEAELLRAIVAEPREQEAGAAALAAAPAPPRRRSPRQRRFGLALAATAAVGAFALAGVSLSGSGDLRTGPDQVWAASALRVADAVPRLLLGGDGWRVTRADQFTVADGEMTFENGGSRVDLHWRAASTHAHYVADRAHDARRLDDAEVAGASAAVFQTVVPGGLLDEPCAAPAGRDGVDCEEPGDGPPYHAYTALWRSGRYSLELRMGGERLAPERFAAVVRELRPASVDAWLSAMPASVVKPADRATEVRGMLAGLPLPDGFDAAALERGDAVRDRYQLGAEVSGAVACAWFDRWIAARGAGDGAAARAAVDALATSRDWAILREMDAEGDYPEVLWQYADAVGGDGTVMGGRPLTVEESVGEALGCDAR